MSASENGDPATPAGSGERDAALFDLMVRFSHEYDADEGVIGKLRFGTFDPDGARRLLALLAQVPESDGPVDLRLVQLLWMMPPVIEWQAQRREDEGDGSAAAIRSLADDIFEEGFRIFGYAPDLSDG